ncbi:hypothetical protein RJG79_01960 [Mycoplasmatota bacterium WC44]
MYISFSGLNNILKTFIKLFLVGVIAMFFVKIVWSVLPLILMGYGTVLLIGYLQKDKKITKSNVVDIVVK